MHRQRLNRIGQVLLRSIGAQQQTSPGTDFDDSLRPRHAQTIVAVGDSITRGAWDTAVVGGWVTRLGHKLRHHYPGRAFVVRNAGVDGDTTAGVLARLERDVLAPRPTLVLVSIGTNDFDAGVPPRTFAARLHLLVGRLRRSHLSPGRLSFTVPLNSRARGALRRHGRMAITVRIVVTPRAGNPP